MTDQSDQDLLDRVSVYLQKVAEGTLLNSERNGFAALMGVLIHRFETEKLLNKHLRENMRESVELLRLQAIIKEGEPLTPQQLEEGERLFSKYRDRVEIKLTRAVVRAGKKRRESR